MRQYTTVAMQKTIKEKKVVSIICNQCGKEIKLDGKENSGYQSDVAKAEVFSAQYCWGYGSKYDTECHEFDLCEACYDKLIQGFMIPLQVEENLIG